MAEPVKKRAMIPSILLRDVKPGDVVPQHAHLCGNCGEVFLGRKNAKFCSEACRMEYHHGP